MTALLHVEKVGKQFGGFVALQDIDLEVQPGERLGLIGPNGSGKSTLVNCICGTLRNETGSVSFIRSCIMPSISSATAPRVGRTKPATHFISVDLPLPLVPSSATVSPAPTFSDTSSSTRTAP